jgi:hypothetical protein
MKLLFPLAHVPAGDKCDDRGQEQGGEMRIDLDDIDETIDCR